MKKILVAGAGHGGLAAAAILAAAGYDVTVIEKGSEGSLGHDWEDRFDFSNLTAITGTQSADFPAGSWRYRGDCAFVSPAKRKKIEIFFTAETRQKVMWRKPLINMLIENAAEKGAKILYDTEVLSPVVTGGRVTGLKTSAGDFEGSLVIDSAGVFSPVRMNLPASFGIERDVRRGDLFYGYRAYFSKKYDPELATPFEVYLYHEGEQGLSWCCTNESTVDILIGRIDPLTQEKIDEQLAIFKKDHPWTGDEIIHGGCGGVIPVRRPLTLMVANGYAAVGDSAFMTMPMNGMGIDLSLCAGRILAETVLSAGDAELDAAALWEYNKRFHREYGAFASKNEGLKNSILSIPSQGVDFLFENGVIQSSDLAGGGRNVSFSTLLGKFARGMKQPKYFFAIVNGLIHGSGAAKLYANPPEKYDADAVNAWSGKIAEKDIRIL